jgi:hypothetical protein
MRVFIAPDGRAANAIARRQRSAIGLHGNRWHRDLRTMRRRANARAAMQARI